MMLKLERSLEPGRKAYFASDFHLGVPDETSSREREKKIVRWLDSIEPDCQYLFLLGDIFDFWFDYHDVVPKGFVRLLGKLAQLADNGIELFLFTGNHDMWMFGYLEKELGCKVYREPIDLIWNGAFTMQVGHGDGLGPGDRLYKVLKVIFNNPICQRLFAFIHPRIGMGIANAWSRQSRIHNHVDGDFLGEREYLWQYCTAQEKMEHRDCFIFGHRHLPIDMPVGEKSRYLNLGEWLHHCRFLVFDGNAVEMRKWG